MDLEERVMSLERRMDSGDRERLSIIEMLQVNKQLVESVSNDTQQIREFWTEARGAFRLFTKIMAVVRWVFKFIVVPVVLLFVAVYAWTHDGKAPNWLHTFIDIVE
jgi:hypothetical protein